jgi:hypothetical protein
MFIEPNTNKIPHAVQGAGFKMAGFYLVSARSLNGAREEGCRQAIDISPLAG